MSGCRCPSLPLGVVPQPFDERCDQPTEPGETVCWYCKKFCEPEAQGPMVNLVVADDGRQLAYRANEATRKARP